MSSACKSHNQDTLEFTNLQNRETIIVPTSYSSHPYLTFSNSLFPITIFTNHTYPSVPNHCPVSDKNVHLRTSRQYFLPDLNRRNEHRLHPDLIASIRSALAQADSQAVNGSALITTAQGKFFSNGFDLRYAQEAGCAKVAMERLVNMVELFKPLVTDLISLRMPTVAAITGHAAAAGLMLAMSHDYVTMRSDQGVLYMSELDIGMTLPDYFTALIRSKISSAPARRALVLRATKIRADEAVQMGIVDSVHANGEDALRATKHLGEDLTKNRWNGTTYAEIRKSLHPELCAILGISDVPVLPSQL